MRIEFTGEVWYWRGPAPYHFITVPSDASVEVRTMAPIVSYGWGMVPVSVRIGATLFETALIPRKETYAMPVKDAVRAAEGLALGDIATVELSIRT